MSDFVVICRVHELERVEGEGEYVRATRQLFPDRIAADRYASTIAKSRAARVVTVAEYLIDIEGWRRPI